MSNGTLYTIFYGRCKKENINAGTYMGPAKLLRTVIQNIIKNGQVKSTTDDQVLLTADCNKYPDKYIIDTESRIFFVCLNEKRCNLALDRSCILHAAGNTNIVPIVKALGYDASAIEVESRKMYGRHKKAAFLHHFIAKYPYLVWSYAIFSLCVAVFILHKMVRR